MSGISKQEAIEKHRPLSTISREIGRDWKNMFYGAVPYYNAMLTMNRITDQYGADDGRSVIAYFLSNAATWRGPDAKRLKNELKLMLKDAGWR